MRIGIRCDANDSIAMGHLMRCLTIARQLKKVGQDVLFFLSETSGVPTLAEHEMPYICLQNDYQNKEQELTRLIAYCQEYQISCILVDSYEVTSDYLKELRKILPVAYLDDVNAMYYPVDLLINYTIDAEKKMYECMGDYTRTEFLLGNQYVPVRTEFIEKRTSNPQYPPQNLFLTSGGTDPYGIIIKIIDGINRTETLQRMKKYVVVGKYYSQMESLRQCADKYGNMEIYQNVPDIWNVMEQADIAVTAGGTTVGELCAMGKPMTVFCIAENQLPGLRGYSRLGAIEYAGDVRDDETLVIQNISKKIAQLSQDRQYYERLAKTARSIVDGRGAYRIAQALITLGNQEMRGQR